MKKLLQRLARSLAPTTRALALFIVVFAAGGAMAFTPTVAWDGDFGTTTKTGTDGATYTFALNPSGNSGESINVVADGKLVIGSDSTYGGVISWPVDLSSVNKMSVLIKYSSLNVTDKGTAVLATATSYQIKAANPNNRTGIDDCVSMYTANGNKLTGRWNNNAGTYGGELANIVAPSGYLLMVYQSGSAFQFWTSSDGVTWSGGTATGLTFGDTYPNAVGLGGMTGLATATPSRFPKMSGMTIEAVAIYRGVALTVAQARNCHFDSEYTTQNYKKWAYANSVLSYNMANNADIGSSSTKVKCFNIATGANVGSDYSGGGDTVYFGSVFWNSFCCYQSAYSAPGCVLRVAGAHAVSAGFNKSTQGPLTLGGLIVESSANGCTFPGNAQSTVLGSASASSETWFGIKGNATIDRNGFLILSGNVNIDVAEGKTFSLNASQTTVANYPTIKANVTAGLTGAGDAGGVLKMHGLGTITVPTLIASNEATLDFSDVQASETVVRETTPFIQGNLTVDATTKLVLPSGTAANASYVLCSGTLTAPTKTVQTSVQVGSDDAFTAYVTYNASDKTVSYSTSAPTYTGTVDGSTITWVVTPTAEDLADGNVVLTGSGEVTLPAEPISINAGSGVTVDVTGYTTAAYSGEGTFKYTSGYPTTVPANHTFAFVGGADAESEVTYSSAVAINGTLKTYGYINLSGQNTLNAGGTLEVVTGQATVATVAGAEANSWSGGFGGTITVDAGAIFVNTTTDALTRNSSQVLINVYGTLSMGLTRWTIQQESKHLVNLYPGAQITGTGDGYGVLDFEDNNSKINVFNTDRAGATVADGNVTIASAVRFRTANNTTAISVAEGTTLTISTAPIGSGKFSKTGAGTLHLNYATWGAGALDLAAGTVNIGQSLAVNITYSSASAAVTASSSAVVTGTITAAANGSAFIAPDTSMQTFLKDSTKWQGTFSIPACSSTSSAHLQLPLHNYGNASSVISLAGVSNQSDSYGTWISGANDTINATVQLNGNVTFNQGSSGKTYTFKKITGTGNLTIAAFSGCTADGLGYVFDEINGYTGTITANNNSSTAACTFSVKIKKIVSSTTPLVKLTVGGTNEKTTIDLSEATVGGESVAVGLATVDGVSGIYYAVATYGGTPYFSLDEAIKAAGDENLGDIVVADSSAEVPEGYALVNTSGALTVRKAGSLIYWASKNPGDWSGEASNTTHTFYMDAAGTQTTTYAKGDTVVIANYVQIWSKTAAHGAKFQIGTDETPAVVRFTRSGDGCDNYILDGSTVEIKSGSTLVAERYGLNTAGTAYDAWNSYSSYAYSDIHDTVIFGEGTLKVGENGGGHGAATMRLLGTTTVSSNVEIADGATVVVSTPSSVTARKMTVASGTVTLDVTDDLSVGNGKLLGWTTFIGEGKFVAGETLTTKLGTYLQLGVQSDGVYVQGLGLGENGTGGYLASETVAVVTNAAANALEIPASVTMLWYFPVANDAEIALEAGSGLTMVGVLATGDVQPNLSKYFTITIDKTTDNKVTITLNADSVRPTIAAGTVTVAGDEVACVEVTSDAKPVFSLTTIPGFWYGVSVSTDGSTFAVDEDTVRQATATSLTLPAASAPTTVKYYKIAVGASKAALK